MPLSFPKPTKTVDEAYLNFVRSQPCAVTGKRPVDAAHLIARGWREPFRNDYSAIPLTRDMHNELHRIGQAAFESRHQVNLWRQAWRLSTEWLLKSADGRSGAEK